VDEGRQIATVVEDDVELLSVLEGDELLLEAPLVLLLGLPLPCKAGKVRKSSSMLSVDVHWHSAGSNCRRGVVLGRVDVAAGPGDLRTKGRQSLNEHGSLDG
jgi:hypothetical protein